jgi:hypothetical protein
LQTVQRSWAFLSILVVVAGCDPGGARLSLQLPAQLDPQQVESIVVEVQGKTATRLGPTAPMPDESLTADGRLLISLDRSAFSFQSQFEVILRPTSSHAVTTGVGACALGPGGSLLAVARPIDLAFPANSAPPLQFACGRPDCLSATLPPYQEIDGEPGDNLTPLGLSHYTASDDTFIVAGAPTRTNGGAATGAVFLTARAPRSCPESVGLADRVIYGRAGDRLGQAAAVGDFDGDGLEDLAVSGSRADGSGVVYVIPNDVLLGAPVIDLGDDGQRAAVYQIDGNGADGFGASLAFAAFSKTTPAESLVVLAPTGTADPADGTGLVYVLYGTAANRASHTLQVGVPLAADGVVVRGAGPGTELQAMQVADANSDGPTDLVVSYSSKSGGAVGIVDSKLLTAGGERRLPVDALIITGTGDRLFGAALAVGPLVRADKTQTFDLIIGSPNEGKVIALAVTSALWQVGGVPPAGAITYRDARLAAYTILGTAGFGNALLLGTLPNETANTLVVANDRLGQVAALRALPAGTMLDVRNALLNTGSVAVLQRADVLHFGSVLKSAKSLADFVVGGPLVDDSRGMIAVYALPSS